MDTLSEIARLLWKDRMSRIAMIYVGFFFSLGILSFIWTPYDYREQALSVARQGPSWAHWFGTDLLGRDMFTRVLYSARITDVLIIMTVFLLIITRALRDLWIIFSGLLMIVGAEWR